jgi:hypothetical protein
MAEGSEFESRKEQDFSTLHVIQTGSGAHPASYTVVNERSSSGCKAAGAWSWPLAPTSAEVKNT